MKVEIKKSSGRRIVELSTKVLRKCTEKNNLDIALDTLRGEEFEKTVSDIVFQYYRNRGKIDHIIAKHSENKKKTPEKFKRILQVAVTQAFLQTGIEPEKAFDIAVGTAKDKYGKRPAGFINAVLRKISASYPGYTFKGIPEKINIPGEILKRWKSSYPDLIKNFNEFISEKPEMTFRLTSPVPSDELKSALCRKLEIPEWSKENQFYAADKPSLIFDKEWIEEGRIYIQDPSTSAACSMYEPEEGDIAFDLCSAPGGKSVILAERLKGKGFIVSSDLSFNRQKRTRQNMERNHIRNSYIITASAMNPPFSANCADLVFLDVPCSNTGVFRRRPDVLWNFTEKKLKELVELQKEILKKSAGLVKAGGKLIYSTCSIEKEENSDQVNSFLQKNPDFKLIKELQLLPCKLHDGAYCALLKKKG